MRASRYFAEEGTIRILPWTLACALLMSCSTSSERAPPAEPLPPAPRPSPPIIPVISVPAPVPAPSPPGPPAVDLTPRPGRPYYPPCTAERTDICLQLNKKPAQSGGGSGNRHRPRPIGGETTNDPVKPPPDPPEPCPTDRPECRAPEQGMGSFGRPRALWVNRAAGLEFAVGMDQDTIIRELGDTPPAGFRDVNVAECMRVTLDAPDAVEIVGPNAQVRRLPEGWPGAFWNWSIRPRANGVFPVHAKVEVLRSEGGKCLEIPIDAYTRLVPIEVRASVWPDRKRCIRDGREVACRTFWTWQSIGMIVLSILFLALLIGAIAAAGRRRRRIRREAA
jgi:hypothetical protein